VFAINHAAAALLIRRRYPDVWFIPILLSVQVMEFLWVALNYLGVERTTTEPVVRYVGDIHLEFMPYSHSVATMFAAAGVAWAAGVALRRPRLGAAVGVGVLSHLLLDLATHNGDIALAPFIGGPSYGTYLYGTLPALAFVVELGFGVFCWWVYRGSRALLAVIVGFNLANASLFFAVVPGLETMLAGRSRVLVTVILLQILVTLWAIWWAADRRADGRVAG
jgi:membrane-bound metal-dependent hydrolase YbcI (DUF457 family)